MSHLRLPSTFAFSDLSLMENDNRVLLCLIEGHAKLLEITVSTDKSIAFLKKVISEEAKDGPLRGVYAPDLVLWKLNEPVSAMSEKTLVERIRGLGELSQFAAELQEPAVRVLDVFYEQPRKNLLHIIVQKPLLPSTERPAKRQKLASNDGTETLAVTSQTAAHGVGRGSAPPKITLYDAIQQAKALLDQNSHSLKLAATTDPQLDDSNPFFVDGLGVLYDTEPSTKDRVLELFGPGTSRVVFNTSGSGKTRLLVEGLCQYWGFYFTPDRHPRLGSTDFSLSLRKMEEYNEDGNIFSPIIPDPKSSPKSLKVNRDIAQIMFRNILLARLLVLEAFLSAGADTPTADLRRRWTYLQLVPSVLTHQFSANGDMRDIFERVYQIIARCRASDEFQVLSLLSTIRQDPRMSSSSPFFVTLDEAQLCSHLYEGAFHSEKVLGPEGIRSVLREISIVWASLGRSSFAVIYSGTGFLLTRMLESSSRSIFSSKDSDVFTNTGAFVSQEQQSAYIMGHVALESDNKEEVLRRAWRWLRGRHRFTAEYVHVLRRCGAKNASALLSCYVKVLTGYWPTDDPRARNMKITRHEWRIFPPFENMSGHLKNLDANDRLRYRVAFAINTFLLRQKPYLFDSSDAETIELGLARYTTSSEGLYKSIVINEPLIIAGALKHFEISGVSLEETLRQSICRLPIGPVRGYDLEAIGMFVLAQQFDGTRSLREIFNFQTPSVDIGKGKAQLIAIDKNNQDGTFRYSIVKDPLRYPFGLGYEAGNPSEHERWFEGTGVPFCFPDPRSGHDVGFFVVVDGNSVIFVTNQFKSYSKYLDTATMRRALKTLAPAECYKDKNGKIYSPGKSARRTILDVLEHSTIPCLGVLTSLPSNPHFSTIDEKAPEHFALFDISQVDAEMEKILAGFKTDQPHFFC